MAFTLETGDGRRVAIDGSSATLGQGDECQIRFPGDSRLLPVHATIRKVADRWLIEAQGDWNVQVGEAIPSRLCWLKPGDRIRLTELGPIVVFEPPLPAAPPQPARAPFAATAGFSVESPSKVRRKAIPIAASSEPEPTVGLRRRTIALVVSGCCLSGLLIAVTFILTRPAAPDSGSKNNAEQSPSPAAEADPPAEESVETRPAPEAQPDRAPTKAAAVESPPSTPEISDAELRAKFADSVVWIGLNLENNTLFQSSGWLIRNDAVITSADVVWKLTPVVRGEKGDVKVVVHARGRTRSVSAARLHPKYDINDPGNRATSVPHGVGMLTLSAVDPPGGNSGSDARPQVSPPNSAGPAIAIGTRVLALAFDSTLERGEPYKESKVTLEIFGGQVAEVLQTSPDIAPIYILKMGSPKSSRGGAVFDSAGRFLGTLSTFGEKQILIPAQEAFRISE